MEEAMMNEDYDLAKGIDGWWMQLMISLIGMRAWKILMMMCSMMMPPR